MYAAKARRMRRKGAYSGEMPMYISLCKPTKIFEKEC